MILPVVAFGDAVLRKKGEEIKADSPALQTLVDDMFDTMHNADGVGIAAPQVGKSLKLFVVEITGDEEEPDFKEVFINAEIIEESGEEWPFCEGCLSIPEIREDVYRKPNIRVKYLNRDFEEKVADFSGLQARVIQHEYDHTEGILFTDKLPILRRTLLRGRLDDINKGKIKTRYRMRFAAARKK